MTDDLGDEVLDCDYVGDAMSDRDDVGDAVSDRDDVGDAVPLQTEDICGSIHIPYEKARLHLKKEKKKGSAFYVWFSPQKLDWFYVEDKVSTNNINNCLVCFYYQVSERLDWAKEEDD